MPQVIPILAYAAAAAAGIEGVALAVVVAFASALSGAMIAGQARKPDAVEDLQSRQRILRSGSEPRRIIYGQVSVSGVLAFGESTDNDRYAHLVILLAGHEVEEIGDIYLNEELLDSDHPAYNYVRVKKHLGATDQVADADLVAEVPQWTESHRLQGIAYLYVRFDWPPSPVTLGYEVWPNGLPNVKAIVKGKKVYDPRTDTTAYSNNFALCVRDYLAAEDGLACSDAEIDDALITAAANVSDEDLEPGDLIDLETVEHDWQFQGVDDGFSAVSGTLATTSEYLYLTATSTVSYILTPLITSINVVDGLYLRVRMRRVSGATWTGGLNIRESDATWTGNYRAGAIPEIPMDGEFHFVEIDLSDPALYQGLTITRIAFYFVFESASQIDIDYIQIGNRSDFKRYTVNGTIKLDRDPAGILDDLMTAGAGLLVYSQGQYKLQAAASSTSVGSLNEDDLRDQINVRPRPGRSDLFNSVRGLFVSPEDAWQFTDFPPVTNATYQAEDGGDLIPREISLPYTTDSVRAQILAKMVLEQARQGIVVEFPAKFSGMLYRPGDVVDLTIDQLGWAAKEFKVVKWSVAHGGVDLVLQEETPESYDWNNGEATRYDPSPDTNLPDPTQCAPPTAVTVASGNDHLGTAVDGTIYARMFVSWTAAATGFVLRYEVEHKKNGDTAWLAGTSQDTTTYIGPVSDGDLYDIRVRTVNSLGVVSDWAYYNNHAVVGKTELPAAPSEFTVHRQADGTREFSVEYADRPADHAGFRIYYKLGTGQTLPNMNLLNTNGLITAFPFESNQLAAGTYTFCCTAVDTSGLESAGIYIESSLADPRIGNIAYSEYPESSSWPGTKTDCSVNNNGYLEADSSTTWADLTTWAAFDSWNDGATSPIIYEHSEIDLGFDVVFTPLITFIGSGTPSIEVQTKADGGTYSSWGSPAPVTARYIKVRCTVTGSTPLFKSLPILLSAETITEEINDLDTSTLTGDYDIAAGNVRLPITKPFTQITQVQIALQSTGGGWSWELIDKDVTTGPEIKVYNSSGTLADATIDAFIRGL